MGRLLRRKLMSDSTKRKIYLLSTWRLRCSENELRSSELDFICLVTDRRSIPNFALAKRKQKRYQISTLKKLSALMKIEKSGVPTSNSKTHTSMRTSIKEYQKLYNLKHDWLVKERKERLHMMMEQLNGDSSENESANLLNFMDTSSNRMLNLCFPWR